MKRFIPFQIGSETVAESDLQSDRLNIRHHTRYGFVASCQLCVMLFAPTRLNIIVVSRIFAHEPTTRTYLVYIHILTAYQSIYIRSSNSTNGVTDALLADSQTVKYWFWCTVSTGPYVFRVKISSRRHRHGNFGGDIYQSIACWKCPIVGFFSRWYIRRRMWLVDPQAPKKLPAICFLSFDHTKLGSWYPGDWSSVHNPIPRRPG